LLFIYIACSPLALLLLVADKEPLLLRAKAAVAVYM